MEGWLLRLPIQFPSRSPVPENRASLLRPGTAPKRATASAGERREIVWTHLWKNYVSFACRVVPPVEPQPGQYYHHHHHQQQQQLQLQAQQQQMHRCASPDVMIRLVYCRNKREIFAGLACVNKPCSEGACFQPFCLPPPSFLPPAFELLQIFCSPQGGAESGLWEHEQFQESSPGKE